MNPITDANRETRVTETPSEALGAKGLGFISMLALKCGDATAIDERCIRVLEALERQGSITGAAKALGIAYRTAWLAIRQVRRYVADPVVVTLEEHGWPTGSALTPRGARLVAEFRAAERAVEALLEQLRVRNDA